MPLEPNEASSIINYVQQIIGEYQKDMAKAEVIPYTLHTEIKMLYNPHLKSAYNFVPGIMGILLILICSMMTSVSIVKEKEQGTMEVLLVSPIKPIYVVLAKAVPYFIISIFNIVTILLMSYFILKVPVAGNIFLLFLLCIIFIFSALALGLLISSITETQQAAMMISGIGLMLPSILLSGAIFPVENMSLFLQIVANLMPVKWFIVALKDVMIKGLGFGSIIKEFLVLLVMTVFLLVVSIKNFKNRL